MLDDCKDAIRYIRDHFDFVNFKDIVYAGDSAGGYLVTMLGLSQEDELRPHTVISLNPVLEVLGEKCAEFLFMHGTSDVIVEIEHTENFHKMLLEKGHKSEFVKIPEAQHAFVLYDYKYPDDYVTKIMEKIIKYLD